MEQEMMYRTACEGIVAARLTEGLGANVVTARYRADQTAAPRIEDHPVMAFLAATEIDEGVAYARLAAIRRRFAHRPPTPAQ